MLELTAFRQNNGVTISLSSVGATEMASLLNWCTETLLLSIYGWNCMNDPLEFSGGTHTFSHKGVLCVLSSAEVGDGAEEKGCGNS